MKMGSSIILGLVALAALGGYQTQSTSDSDQTYTRFANAHVFDGASFVQRDICVERSQIVSCKGLRGAAVDMAGAYITPPFGDAHTHHFDGPYGIDWQTKLGLQSGAFYAMNLTAQSTQVALIRDRFRGPTNVDVVSSLGGITGPESHPAEIYEANAIGAYSYEDQLARAEEIRAGRKVADDAYYVVENKADFERKWPLITSRSPDLIKVFLRTSERYEEGFGKWGPGGGIDPKLLPFIRDKANAEGLRLAVATSTLGDFRAAVRSGADIVTHLPCNQDTSSDPDSPYYVVRSDEQCMITTADAQEAASVGLAAVLITSEWAKDRPQQVVDWERHNIQVLESAGVALAVGSNAYGLTLTDGLVGGVNKGLIDPVDLLRMASIVSPRLIFPARRVGCLEVGCEASFIAFATNPIRDFSAVRTIVYRLKDGEPVILDTND